MQTELREDVSSLTLRPNQTFSDVIDASAIRPSTLKMLKRSEIGAIRLSCGSRSTRIDELFELEGEPSDKLIFDGNCSKLARIGDGMEEGSIVVRGDAGPLLASRMNGGHVEVHGNCGDNLAMSMRNGTVIVHGSAGDSIAGPDVGQRHGMRGGDCIVLGNVGCRAAERMRRGTLYIGGNAGDDGAAQLIAGTIVVVGEIGARWAVGMKRGTIVLSQPTNQEFGAELTRPREFELSFLPLLWRHLERRCGKNNVKISGSRWAMRQLGDRANQGLGEVLTLTRFSSA